LIGKNVQISYVGPDLEESRALGKLRSATAELIEIVGIMDTTLLLRKNVKIIEIKIAPSSNPSESNMVRLFIRKTPGMQLSPNLLRKIGGLIEQGKTCAKNNPKGIEWELANWDPVPPSEPNLEKSDS
jgi:hypothetical protein